MSEEQKRQSRNASTRERQERPLEWRPPHKAAEIEHTEDFIYRWLREEYDGQRDTRNMENKMREGYQVVSPNEPQIKEMVERGELRVSDGKVVKGGLVLGKIDRKLAEQRNAHYHKDAKLQQQTVNQALNRSQHESMPLYVDRDTRD
jgi:hypothetical protein